MSVSSRFSAALLAPPLARDVWLGHFQRLANDDRLRADLVARGRLQASRFRWSDAAFSYLGAMAQIDAGGAPPHL
jgi:hypothetical protein